MTTNTSLRFVLIILLCSSLLTGCRRNHQSLRLVCIIDLSSSIEADARAEAFTALRAIFAERRLRRGDTVVVVPVVNDAVTEAQGQVLRFEISERRAAYDADLQNLVAEVERALGKMQIEASARPSTYSDILGAISLAEEELTRGNSHERKVIVVLSDLIHDTSQGNFRTTPQLATNTAARNYAAGLAEGRARPLNGAQIYLGLLRSTELRRVQPERRAAIQSFWTEYLQREGAASVSMVIDGPRQLAIAIQPSL